MQANEFVKKVGWERSKKALEMSAGDFSRAFDIDKGFIIVRRDELKRLVKSHELVEEYGGLSEALEFIRYAPIVPEIYKLRDAIEDVESCQ